ncbi:MAG TPA: transglutaminase domain-containing protein [Dehalococcoidia bacterium]
MRQATWQDFFKNPEPQPDATPAKPPWWKRFAVVSWEELVTFVIVFIGFMAVVQSIDSADWVSEMPSLYPIAFFGLLLGITLAKTPLNEAVAHFLAILLGTAAVVYVASGELEGSAQDRVSALYDRMHLWVNALTSGGISNDNLPFVVLIVSLCFLTAYISAWSLFRWYNAWIGLIPGGLALLTNISYLPGQHSGSLLVFLFCSVLLVSRMHVLRRELNWRETGIRYPDLMSLHVLNVTVWVAIGLLFCAWVLPVGSGKGVIFDLWSKATAPVSGPFESLGRVFSSIDSKKGGVIHHFGPTLPLQGQISLGGSEVAQVVTTEPVFLRAQTYDQYTPQGWKLGPTAGITTTSVPALKPIQNPDDARRQFRRPISIDVTTSKEEGVILSAGQPLDASIDARVVSGADPSDVSSLRPSSTLKKGTEYRVDGTVSNASQTRLRQAGTAYPSWITPYLQIPDSVPASVKQKAREVAAGADNAYDKAAAIEKFLRANYPIDTTIKPAPANRDSVAYFLFDVQKGYFDYHATAMVVMLRALGVPARIAVGYVIRPQDRIPDTNTYTVGEANAFAWPEVYFPNLGWVEFNPTSSEPAISRPTADDPSLAGDIDGEITPDELPPEELLPPEEPASAPLAQLSNDNGSNLVGNILMAIVAAVLVVTVAGGLAFQFVWQRGMGGLDYPSQIWEKTQRLARWARIPTYPQQTPREYVARLKTQLPEVDDLDLLSTTYTRSRYGGKKLDERERDRLTTVWKAVRKDLMGRILRWR